MTQRNYTIIIPHRNTPELLAHCLGSIPVREDVAVVVVDDHSDAPCAEQVHRLCAQYEHVQLIASTEGGGAGFARNIGLQQVDSRWVLFADADDYFLPEAWQAFDRHIDDTADVIYFRSQCRYSDTGALGDRHIRPSAMVDAYLRRHDERTEGDLRYNYYEPWGKMFRASLIRDNGITFEQTRWANDVHFSTMAGACARAINADEAEVYCITITQGSLVHQHSLESRRCRYEVILRNNAYLRQIGKPEYQDSLMYSLKWAAKLGGLKAVWEFVRIGRTYGADFTIGAAKWWRNFFRSRDDYKGKDKYIIR